MLKKLCLLLLFSLLEADEIVIPQREAYVPIFANVSEEEKKEPETEDICNEEVHVPKKSSTGIPRELKKILDAQYERKELVQRTITLTLKSVKVVDAIELLGKSAGINFVVDSNVRGTVKNISLKEVPIAGALKAILANNDPELTLKKEFGIFRVLRLDKAVKSLKVRFEELKKEDYRKAVVLLQNANLNAALKKRIKGMWRGITGKKYDEDGVYLVFDDDRKKLFFRGTRNHIADMKNYLHEIDVRLPQVKIEARVVIARKDFDESLGLQLSGLYEKNVDKGVGLARVGSLSGIKSSEKEQTGLMDWALNLFPEVGVNNKRLQLPFVFGGRDLSTKCLNLVLNAAENRGELKTILKPTILTNHGEESEILVGNSIPIETIVKENVEGTSRDITTATYKDVGTKLRVKPSVSPDKKSVLLDIFVENSSYTMQNKFPLITSTRTKNRVRLRSGQTTMIGGLIENSKRKDSSAVPILGEIPLLGRLFRGSYKETKEHQLLIFITPKVV